MRLPCAWIYEYSCAGIIIDAFQSIGTAHVYSRALNLSQSYIISYSVGIIHLLNTLQCPSETAEGFLIVSFNEFNIRSKYPCSMGKPKLKVLVLRE